MDLILKTMFSFEILGEKSFSSISLCSFLCNNALPKSWDIMCLRTPLSFIKLITYRVYIIVLKHNCNTHISRLSYNNQLCLPSHREIRVGQLFCTNSPMKMIPCAGLTVYLT